MLTLTNRIDMRPGAVPLVIHLGQYDSDFSLVFELYSSAGNFTVESGTTAMIRGTKTDGHAYDADATINISAKTVTVAGSEQMTAAKGRNVYELVLKKGTKVLSTANFILDVERAAMDADTIASESVLKELNAIIDSAATSTQAAADAASAADRAEDAADSVSSASAQIATNTADISDLKADLSELEEAVDSFEGISDEVKEALLACFRHVPFLDDDADYYNALRTALYASTEVISISAVFNPGTAVIYPNATLDDLKEYLTVTATYADSHTSEVTSYTLSGTIAVGVCTITVSHKGNTTTFNVTVSDYEWGSDYTWLYRADRDGLFSDNENLSGVAQQGTPIETLSGDVLNVQINDGAQIYKVNPLTSSNAVLKAKVRFKSLPTSTTPDGLRLQVSNGSTGAQIFAHKHTQDNVYSLRTNAGAVQHVVANNIALNRWYIIECELRDGKQILTVDGNESQYNELSNYACTESRVIVQGASGLTDVDIAWVAFKNNSNE